ncbi:hypothetical protein [Microbacterium radiodurans]|uniref:Uncharacterized protein n=1 Tax=Microbacterium radiodurans TaxID=661398 RepID=A0A5J5IQN9_9MICO|nr:hypothetical protein [Microbacterium radiodurans]KAA9086745.1 hypothetical protein F6B42_07010 [Microbacterium radiodurans]
MPDDHRRIELILRRPRLALWAGVRPTLVIGGNGQPTQWGSGTWRVSATEPVELRVFLFARGWRFGEAVTTLAPATTGRVIYRAPVLPFGAGRFTLA